MTQPALGKQKQANLCECQVSSIYKSSSRMARKTETQSQCLSQPEWLKLLNSYFGVFLNQDRNEYLTLLFCVRVWFWSVLQAWAIKIVLQHQCSEVRCDWTTRVLITSIDVTGPISSSDWFVHLQLNELGDRDSLTKVASFVLTDPSAWHSASSQGPK